MKRRYFLAGAAALGAGTLLGFKPGERGENYTAYFQTLNSELREKGPYRPSLIIDLDQLQKNIAALQKLVRPGVDYRIVVKSLPCPKLLGHIMTVAKTNKLMVFHQPFLNHVAEHFPSADVLMGKPMPVKAAGKFYQQFDGRSGFDPSRQLQWLIDTPERLQQYQQMARHLEVKLRVNIELDVGLHRGGLQSPDVLRDLLKTIETDADHLSFAGLMGYDPHVVKIPTLLKSRDEAFAESQKIYKAYIDLLEKEFPNINVDSLCLNGAGSPTIALHARGSLINDIAAGSCLVKPTDFDIDTLEDFMPAAFIATPVLKKMHNTRLPGAEAFSTVFSALDPNQQQTFFIYGGKWMADYESPTGLQNNNLYGDSTNQQMINGSGSIDLSVDDFVFLRPHQSEFVFLQFGDLLAVRDGRVVDHWPILRS